TDLIAYTEMINATIDEESAELKRQVVALAKRRIGFIAEVAGASSFFTTAHDKFEKAGIWINASNVVSQTDAWNFSARYFFADSDSATSNFDFGLAYIKELSNLCLSVEAMGRSYRAEIPDFNINNEPVTIVEKDFTYRLAAQASYRIAEDISVNLSFGKNFDSPFIERGGFFSILGVRYSIFKSNVAGMPAARALK
ncbi:MAG TPA: hypothetical protein VD927_14665, partial [Chryseosolibacter sp.]|nr:hypothetical protein [Chryseosolibacter sp.]